MSAAFARTRQCKACPWKESTDPHTDIPGGYSVAKHANLKACRADGLRSGPAMACHESPPGSEQACVGWVVNQLGPGNNFALRMASIGGQLNAEALHTDGAQYDSLDSMVASSRRRKRKAGAL